MPDQDTMKRRTVLRSISLGAIGATAGCLQQKGDSGVRIPEVQVSNSTHNKQTINIKIDYNDNTILNKKYTIPGQEGSVAHGPVIEDLPDTAGHWTVEGTIMGVKKRNHIKTNINKHVDKDCTIPMIDIFENPLRLGLTTIEDCDFATYSG